MKTDSLVKNGVCLAALLLPLLCATALALRAQPGAGPSSAHENELYDAGTRAMNEGRWSDAEESFRKANEIHGQRADGALYWEAYAWNKLGQAQQALESCTRLRRAYPQSKWLSECAALEIELGSSTGSAVRPETEPDEDLKLLALNALMHQDPDKALPIAKSILAGNHSTRIKERALFVVAQSQSKDAEDLLKQLSEGHADPALQVKAIQLFAAMQGTRASGSMAELYRNTQDVKIKKAILQAYLMTGDHDRLLVVARSESDPQLVRTAARTLGALGAAQDLASLYRSANNASTKGAILDSFIMCGTRGKDAVLEIATSEQDPALRQKAIRNIGMTGGAASGAALVNIYGKSADPGSKNAALEALFMAGDAHDLVTIGKSEKDPVLRRRAIEKLSMMSNKEASDYMAELLK